MIVQVTLDDIHQGVANSSSRCPIAQALKRQGCSNVAVTSFTIRLYPRAGAYAVQNTPMLAQKFIDRYDKNLEVDPFEFELE